MYNYTHIQNLGCPIITTLLRVSVVTSKPSCQDSNLLFSQPALNISTLSVILPVQGYITQPAPSSCISTPVPKTLSLFVCLLTTHRVDSKQTLQFNFYGATSLLLLLYCSTICAVKYTNKLHSLFFYLSPPNIRF